jgi:hypothetical protein
VSQRLILGELQIRMLHFLPGSIEAIRRFSTRKGSHSAVLESAEANALIGKRLLQPAPMCIQCLKIAVLQLGSNLHLAVSSGQLQLQRRLRIRAQHHRDGFRFGLLQFHRMRRDGSTQFLDDSNSGSIR